MEYKKRCQWCGVPFIAHKLTTLYCCKACWDKAYEAKRRQNKREAQRLEVESARPVVESIGTKEFLNPTEAARLLGVSRASMYRYMEQGVSEDAIGNALEDVGSKGCADDDSTKSETVVCQDGRGKEAVVGTNKSHHHIANQKVSLRHRHIMFLRRLTLDEIEHGWRALHAKEASHQSAQCSCTHLYSFSCRQLDLLTEQRKINADKDESYT